MTELLTAAQMRAIEQAAIDSGDVTGLELMERAGHGVVEAIFEEWPEFAKTSRRAIILCGPGNNGGDGFVVARLLKERGWGIEVFFYGDAEKLPQDALVNYDRWGEFGHIREMADFDVVSNCQISETTAMDCLIVDAVFGIGLSRPLEAEIDELAKYLACRGLGERPAIVSIDIPSGICTESGRILGNAFPSDLTVTFHLPKLGHYLSSSPQMVGHLIVKSIGLPHSFRHPIHGLKLASNTECALGLPHCKEWDGTYALAEHKYDHGHALILSGGPAQTGAARLAARGALRIGAGVVTLGVPPSAQMECAMHLTAIMLKRIPDADALTEALKDQRINALCLGPALGLNDRSRALIEIALKSNAAVVLDADALSLYADDPEILLAQTRKHGNCVLTPHAGEFARLFSDIAANLAADPTTGPAYSKVDATRDAAKRAGCVVLFKGPDTVIADPQGRCSINSAQYERTAPWLATAGSGDVLAGFITGLLARGFDPMQASETAAWLHVECARTFGPGLIAEDLPEQLPKIFRELGV